MTEAVVVVGPSMVRGPGAVDAELASLALNCIDDDLALVDDAVVRTDRLWRDVLAAAIEWGEPVDRVVLVCPSWWPSVRIDRVEEAARDVAVNVVVLARREVLASESTVVEIGPEVVVVYAESRRHAIARTGPSEGVIGAVVAYLTGVADITVDVPAGGSVFGAHLATALRHRGVHVAVVDDGDVIREVGARGLDVVDAEPSRWRDVITPRVGVLAAATLAVIALVTAALRVDTESAPSGAASWLVVGRIAVEVPATWRVDRITTGPGSARVQVISPGDGAVAIQVVQARVPDATLAATADALRAALAAETAEVFVDFEAAAQRAGRPVVTYREVRADRQVWWTVFLDHGIRIAIGCQGRVDATGLDRDCDRAVRSARAVA